MTESEVQVEGRYFHSLNFTFTWERMKCSAKWKMQNGQRLIHHLPFIANLPQTTVVWTWALDSNKAHFHDLFLKMHLFYMYVPLCVCGMCVCVCVHMYVLHAGRHLKRTEESNSFP